jgi:Flp pilus assembly protein TadD
MLEQIASTSSQAAAPAPVFPPRTASDYVHLGQILQKQGKQKEAAVCFQRALSLEPANLSLYNLIAGFFQKLGQTEQAVACYRHIVAHAPKVAEAHACLGNALRDAGSLKEAATCFQRALVLKPDHANFHNSLAVILRELDQVDDATSHYQQALILQPDFVEARWNLSLLQLLEGNFAEGWNNYEVRWQRPNTPRHFSQPLWRGQPLHGERILLHSEQGLGDNIQFLRYVPMVEAAGGSVILDLPPSQHSLAAQIPGISNLTLSAGSPPPFDWHCPLMSLPLAFGTTLQTIPSPAPYLYVPPEARRRAAERPWPKQGPRIGLVWSGNPQHPRDHFRSIPLALLQPLLDMENVHYFSLQLGPAAAQLEPWRNRITDLAPAPDDMADMAALMQQLDLILTVDTLAAHLAGALGLPVWLLLNSVPDWRWMRHRSDSPWYPSLRIFRQTESGNWQAVIERVRNAWMEYRKTSAPDKARKRTVAGHQFVNEDCCRFSPTKAVSQNQQEETS